MNWIDAGLVDYQYAWDMQRQLARARSDGVIDDTLLILQHPHTYTLGSSGSLENLLMGEVERQRRGVTVIQADRGGDITYHGPGQLVAYPILALGRLQPDGRLPQADYVGYIRRLEEVIILTLKSWNLHARREEGFTGAWVDTPAGPEKIAAIGVKITSEGISLHGLALNVDPDLSFFAGVIPCGIADRGVTSMSKLLGDACPSMSEVVARFRVAFEVVFQRQLHEVSLDNLHLAEE